MFVFRILPLFWFWVWTVLNQQNIQYNEIWSIFLQWCETMNSGISAPYRQESPEAENVEDTGNVNYAQRDIFEGSSSNGYSFSNF